MREHERGGGRQREQNGGRRTSNVLRQARVEAGDEGGRGGDGKEVVIVHVERKEGRQADVGASDRRTGI